MTDRLEWDDQKAARNWHDHGVRFDQAVKAISDSFAVEWIHGRRACELAHE
jgi:uncharacterized DUF497 family protein